MQPGIGVGDLDIRWGCFSTITLRFLEEVLGVVTFIVPLVTCQQPFKLFDVVDQKLAEATGKHVICFLVVLITRSASRCSPWIFLILRTFLFENFYVSSYSCFMSAVS